MAETFSDVIRRTSDEDKRKICCWCAAEVECAYPVTEVYKGETLTVYCCTVEHQQLLQAALQ